MPPNAVPPTYSPMASPIDLGCISSDKYPIATAGRPDNTSPIAARTTRNQPQRGIVADSMVSSAAPMIDPAMIALRPQASESALAINSAPARVKVVTDNARLATMGVT